MNKVLFTAFLGVIFFNDSVVWDFAKTTVSLKPFSQNDSAKVSKQDISAQVKKAFLEVKNGSYSSANELIKFGDKIFPFIEPYLNDEDARVRNEVVRIAFDIRGEKTLPLIAKALTNSKEEVRIRTANNLYLHNRFAVKYLPLGEFSKFKDFLPEKIAAHSSISEALKENIKAGNISLQSIFLLANFPSKETENILKQLSKVSNSSESKMNFLAAKIVLSRFGDIEATRELSEIAAQNDIDSLQFLLGNISEIDSKEMLSSLSKTLDNKTFIVQGRKDGKMHDKLPGGVWVEYRLARRLCDLAVNSFVEKFNLKTNFGLHSTIYTEKQLLEVRSKVKNSIIN